MLRVVTPHNDKIYYLRWHPKSQTWRDKAGHVWRQIREDFVSNDHGKSTWDYWQVVPTTED